MKTVKIHGTGKSLVTNNREGKHLANVVVLSQQLNNTVYAHPPSCRWRKSVLESIAKTMVGNLSLAIAIDSVLLLPEESFSLFIRIVQFLVRINKLPSADKQFKSGSNASAFFVHGVLGQGTHDQRMAKQESGVDAFRFNEPRYEFIQYAGYGMRLRYMNILFATHTQKFGHCVCRTTTFSLETWPNMVKCKFPRIQESELQAMKLKLLPAASKSGNGCFVFRSNSSRTLILRKGLLKSIIVPSRVLIWWVPHTSSTMAKVTLNHRWYWHVCIKFG